MSRPRLSVPIQNRALGGFIRAIDSSYAYGAIRSAKTAITSNPRMITPPIVPSGFSRAKRSVSAAARGRRRAIYW